MPFLLLCVFAYLCMRCNTTSLTSSWLVFGGPALSVWYLLTRVFYSTRLYSLGIIAVWAFTAANVPSQSSAFATILCYFCFPLFEDFISSASPSLFISQPAWLFALTNAYVTATCNCHSMFTLRKRGGWLSVLFGILIPLCCAADQLSHPKTVFDEALISFYILLSCSCNKSDEVFVYHHLFAVLCAIILGPGVWYTAHCIASTSGCAYVLVSKQTRTMPSCRQCIAA